MMDSGPFWNTALGGFIAAAAGLAAQWWAAHAAKEGQERTERRIDAGVSRQLKALFRDVQEMVFVARRDGMYNLKKFEPVYQRVADRIYEPDVPTALSDDQAEATYALAFTVKLALSVIADLERDFERGPEPRDATQHQRLVAATSKNAWAGFQTLWEAFGDAERSKEWASRNDEIAEAHARRQFV